MPTTFKRLGKRTKTVPFMNKTLDMEFSVYKGAGLSIWFFKGNGSTSAIVYIASIPDVPMIRTFRNIGKMRDYLEKAAAVCEVFDFTQIQTKEDFTKNEAAIWAAIQPIK